LEFGWFLILLVTLGERGRIKMGELVGGGRRECGWSAFDETSLFLEQKILIFISTLIKHIPYAQLVIK